MQLGLCGELITIRRVRGVMAAATEETSMFSVFGSMSTKTGVARFFWPEAEFNSSFYSGGTNDGKIATFATPGIVIGRIPLAHNPDGTPGRLGLTFGAGEQIALTHFHTFNHGIVLTARVPF